MKRLVGKMLAWIGGIVVIFGLMLVGGVIGFAIGLMQLIRSANKTFKN